MRLRLTALLAAVLLLCPAMLAAAAPPEQVSALCDNAPDGCAVRSDSWMREGATFPVTVKGNPGARVQVVLYAATMEGSQVTALTPIGLSDDVFVGSAGSVSTSLGVPPVDDDLAGGWALISLDGVTLATLPDAVGGWVPFGSRIPTLLGDGYGDQKPVGRTLELAIVGTIPGSKFAVDYLDDAGAWHDATAADDANEPARRPDEAATVRYVIPRGLSAEPYTFRLRNLTSGTAEITWEAIPSATGQEQARTAWVEPAPPGKQVDGAVTVSPRPSTAVKAVAGTIGGAALLTVVLGVPAARRRGRLDD